MKLYFWVKLTRVTGKVCAGWNPSSTCDNSDAKATGIFNDTVEGVYFQTVWPSFTESQIREKFQTEVSFLAIECGFRSYQVVTISESEYYALQRKYAYQRLEAMGVTEMAIVKMRMQDQEVIDRVIQACSADERSEVESLIEQMTSSPKGANHEST